MNKPTIAVAIGLMLLIGGCQGVPVAHIEAGFEATAQVNPDPNGRASPIVVILFELTSLSAFDNSDFFALYDRGETTLGATFRGREELQFRPGEQRAMERDLQPGSKFIGVIAAYRDVDVAVWRASMATPPGRTTRIAVLLGESAISIGPGAR